MNQRVGGKRMRKGNPRVEENFKVIIIIILITTGNIHCAHK